MFTLNRNSLVLSEILVLYFASQEILEKARLRDTGVKLEVNEKILDSVTKLMAEIQQLVRKSKDLQAEVVASGRVSKHTSLTTSTSCILTTNTYY